MWGTVKSREKMGTALANGVTANMLVSIVACQILRLVERLCRSGLGHGCRMHVSC